MSLTEGKRARPAHPDGAGPAKARAEVAWVATRDEDDFRSALCQSLGNFETSGGPKLAASKGVYEGPARRVSGPSEFGRIARGDVLVTASTTEAFNILLPLLGGIVTDNGGLLSHAAIVSREYGIPGVVGTREATERIADGVVTGRARGINGKLETRLLSAPSHVWHRSCPMYQASFLRCFGVITSFRPNSWRGNGHDGQPRSKICP